MAARIVSRIFSSTANRITSPAQRFMCVSANSDGEKQIAEVLQKAFSPTSIEVADISGGCGSMYGVSVESEAFRGKRQVEQHKMVNKALAAEIKAMHGLRITTSVPES
eukprot:scpid57089/ scgid24939/ BolA-like protein 3